MSPSIHPLTSSQRAVFLVNSRQANFRCGLPYHAARDTSVWVCVWEWGVKMAKPFFPHTHTHSHTHITCNVMCSICLLLRAPRSQNSRLFDCQCSDFLPFIFLSFPVATLFEYCDREAKTACSGWWVHVHVEDPTNRLVCLIRL